MLFYFKAMAFAFLFFQVRISISFSLADTLAQLQHLEAGPVAAEATDF